MLTDTADFASASKSTIPSKMVETALFFGSHTVPNIPIANFDQDVDSEGLARILWTKFVDWEYEKEWRFIQEEGNVLVRYPGQLKTVIFGCRCSPHSEERVREALLMNANITYRRASLEDSRYELRIDTA